MQYWASCMWVSTTRESLTSTTSLSDSWRSDQDLTTRSSVLQLLSGELIWVHVWRQKEDILNISYDNWWKIKLFHWRKLNVLSMLSQKLAFLTRNWKHIIKYYLYVKFPQIFALNVQICAKFSCKNLLSIFFTMPLYLGCHFFVDAV